MSPTETGYFMNIAPEPATGSGIFRLVAQLDGEVVRRADAHIGFSHRGIEKLMEGENGLQGLFFCSMLCRPIPFAGEHAFVLAAERLLGIRPPERAEYIRMLAAELARILSHLKSTADLADDTGTEIVRPIAARASRRIYALIARMCGASFPAAFFRIGGVRNDIPASLPDELFRWLTKEMPAVLHEIEELLTENRIFKARTVGIGVFNAEQALEAGFSGVNLRASGVAWDLRRTQPYDAYDREPPEVSVGKKGDCYTRFRLRIYEIYHALDLIRRVISAMPEGAVMLPEYDVPPRGDSRTTAESVIRRFKLYADGTRLPAGEVYAATESPFGEAGVYLVSDGSAVPYRCHFRSAGFPHVQAAKELLKGCELADVRPILTSLNFLMTEVDR